MSESRVNKAIILSEETYQRLLDSSASVAAPVKEDRATSPISAAHHNCIQPEVLEEIIDDNQPETTINFDPLSKVPAPFSKAARDFLLLLSSKAPGITWCKKSGILSLGGEETPGLSIADLVRVACVPLVKPQLPQACIDLLKESGITQFRNHLLCAQFLPAWSPLHRF